MDLSKMQLKKEYQEKRDEFEEMLDTRGCSCHINPPCAMCVHEGNPANLIENEDAWEDKDVSGN